MNKSSDINIYAADCSSPEPEWLQALKTYTQAHVHGAQISCGRIEGRLLKWLVEFTRASRVLELGTYTGYSALSMAEALPSQGSLITCDKVPQTLEIARRFIAKSPYADKITLIEEEALSLLERLEKNQEKFDFIFIDANKKPYPAYAEYALKLLSPQGMIVIDNTLFKGEVLNPETETACILDKLNRALVQQMELDILLLPMIDGMTLIRRKI